MAKRREVPDVREALEILYNAVDNVLDQTPDGFWGIWSDCAGIAKAMETAKAALAVNEKRTKHGG